MSLRLIYGRSGSGKSHFCLNDIKDRLDDGSEKPLVLIVPEQYSFQAEANLVGTVGRGGIMRAEVLSFRRLAYRVFNEVGGVTRRHINNAGKCMLLYRILDGMKDEVKVFSRAMLQQGFVNTLSEAVAEFKRYNLAPGALQEAASRVGENDLLSGKLKELALVYSAFEDILRGGYMDMDDNLTVLAAKFKDSERFDCAQFWIDGFTGFTPQEYSVIEQLLLKAERVNISLCTDKLPDNGSISGTDVFSPVKTTAAKLMKLAAERGLACESPVYINNPSLDRFKGSAELRHLEQQLFSYPYKPYGEETRDISLFSSVNAFSEVENTAADIIRHCRDKGLRYRDIAVVTRNLSSYEKLIEVIFKQYDIPFFIDSKRNVADHPLMQLVVAVLEIFTKNWSYEAVFKYLKTGLTGIEREDIDFLENYVLANGIRGSRWTAEAWSSRADKPGISMSDNEKRILERAEDIRRRVIEPLLEFRTGLRGKKSAKEICTSLYELLCRLGLPEKMEEIVEDFRKTGELDLANEYKQVWNILMEVFDQIVEALGEETTGMERFSRMLAIGIGEYKVGLIPPALDQVLVGSVERSRSHEIKALYILGANDGLFPAASKDEGILSDSDRESLRAVGVELAQDTRARAFEELMLVYMVMTTPSGYLRLSYPIADHEGHTLRPSMIVPRLRKLFARITETSNIISSENNTNVLEAVNSPLPTLDRLVVQLRRKHEGFYINPLWSKVYEWYCCRPEWAGRCSTALTGFEYSNREAPIGKSKIRELYGSTINSSVSRLEKYASCPFSYYVEYGLGAKERKMFRLSAPDVGTFIHLVVDEFSKQLANKGISWRAMDREFCSKEISRIVDELLEGMRGSVFNSSKRYRYLAERLKRVLIRTVWLISEHIRKGGFEPLGYEVAFGEKDGLPPIVVELPEGEKLKLRGRIDRIDALKTENGTYLRIIDYKSGARSFKLSDVYYGLQIQLITYMDALWENGLQEGLPKPVLPGGVLYFRIDDPLVKGDRAISEEEVERAIMKQLKMKGLLLADVKVIKEMDRQIEGDSLIIPARINKNGELGRSSAATAEQFELLRTHTRRLLVRLAGEIVKGNVEIKPYKNGKLSACSYCSYHSVCRFDTSLGENKYRVVNDLKDDEVWPLIREEQEGNFS